MLADHLAKCADEGVDAHLTPELLAIAIRVLRTLVAGAKYQLKSVAADGTVAILAAVDKPELLRAAYRAAVAPAPPHTLQIRRGADLISLDEALS
jgi:hypothetical protein